jgi:hypothetical protein
MEVEVFQIHGVLFREVEVFGRDWDEGRWR